MANRISSRPSSVEGQGIDCRFAIRPVAVCLSMTPRQEFVEAQGWLANYIGQAHITVAEREDALKNVRAACEAWADMVCSDADWSADCVRRSNTRVESKLRHKNECVAAILKEVFDV